MQGLLKRHALLGRHGHNEQDSPNAGFPLTYARVAAHPRVLALYSERLVREGALQPAQLSAWHADVESEFQREYAAAEAGEYAESVEAWLATSWQGDALHVRTPPHGRVSCHLSWGWRDMQARNNSITQVCWPYNGAQILFL